MKNTKLTPEERFALKIKWEPTSAENRAAYREAFASKYPYRMMPHETRMMNMLLFIQFAMGNTNTPLSYVSALFTIKARQPLQLGQLAESLGIVRSTVTRMAEAMSQGVHEYNKHLVGHGYIRVVPDPLDNRTKLLELTPAGEHLVEFSKFILEGGASIEELLTGQKGVIDAMTKE